MLLPAVENGDAASRVGVVIRYADGTVHMSCVTFDEQSISGLQLLQSAVEDVIAQPAPGNAAICKIGGDGCDYPAEPCFCKFGAGKNEYWAYWQLDGREWRYGRQGAGARRVHNGDVDGWAYGSGSGRPGSAGAVVERGTQPPVASFDEICPIASETQPAVPASLDAVVPAVPVAPSVADAGNAAPASPLPGVAGARAPRESGARAAGGWGSYLLFGTMMAAVLGAIAVVLRRRGAR